jgi:hypothetical protein
MSKETFQKYNTFLALETPPRIFTTAANVKFLLSLEIFMRVIEPNVGIF